MAKKTGRPSGSSRMFGGKRYYFRGVSGNLKEAKQELDYIRTKLGGLARMSRLEGGYAIWYRKK